jgi:hypothetical protein
MAKNISKELETAILAMPSKEKNKILIRLIAKNKILIEQLQFRLLEDSSFDLKVREEAAKEQIDYHINFCRERYPNLAIKHLRSAYSAILHYKKITADKIGEIKLGIYFVQKVLKSQGTYLQVSSHDSDRVLIQNYICKRLAGSYSLIGKIHEDYRIEFSIDFQEVLLLISGGNISQVAQIHGLPKHFEL